MTPSYCHRLNLDAIVDTLQPSLPPFGSHGLLIKHPLPHRHCLHLVGMTIETNFEASGIQILKP